MSASIPRSRALPFHPSVPSTVQKLIGQMKPPGCLKEHRAPRPPESHTSPAARPLPVWLPGLCGEWRGPAGVCCVLTRPFWGHICVVGQVLVRVCCLSIKLASLRCCFRGFCLVSVAPLHFEFGVWTGAPSLKKAHVPVTSTGDSARAGAVLPVEPVGRPRVTCH